MINYVKGDATAPVGSGLRCILHVCNNVGAWGRGFSGAVSKRWKKPEEVFRFFSPLPLNDVQIVLVEPDLYVVNMVAQKGLPSATNPQPLQYDVLIRCLDKFASVANLKAASIHVPKIGAGFGGGNWLVIESMLMETFRDREVTVYAL